MKKIIFIITILLLTSCSQTEVSEDNNVNVIAEDCAINWWTWLEEFNECEYISQNWCDENWWNFNECESACRNDPEAEFCTLQCVPVCSFLNNEDLSSKKNWKILSKEEATKLIIDNIWDCSKNECDNLEVNIIKLDDSKYQIESIYDWLRDDSVRAIKRVYMVNYIDFKWELWSEISNEYKCQKWRWQEDFWRDLCM